MSKTLQSQLLNLATTTFDGEVLTIEFPHSNQDLSRVLSVLSDLFNYQSDYIQMVESDSPNSIAIRPKPGNTWEHLETAMNE